MSQLLLKPKLGASWEGFALEETLHAFQPDHAYFHAVHGGSELDLFFMHQSRRLGVEFKREDAPRVTKSMRVTQQDLRLDRLFVVYPGLRRYELAEGMECVPVTQLTALAQGT
jgi:predicted AAA+ superfamily ATPase